MFPYVWLFWRMAASAVGFVIRRIYPSMNVTLYSMRSKTVSEIYAAQAPVHQRTEKRPNTGRCSTVPEQNDRLREETGGLSVCWECHSAFLCTLEQKHALRLAVPTLRETDALLSDWFELLYLNVAEVKLNSTLCVCLTV